MYAINGQGNGVACSNVATDGTGDGDGLSCFGGIDDVVSGDVGIQGNAGGGGINARC